MRLRPTLVTSVVGLVLLTAAAIAAAGGLLTLKSTRALTDQARSEAVSAASSGIEQFFEIAPETGEEFAALARRGVLPLDQPDKLVAVFAERLRLEPQLSWIGYGEARSGRYVGATRNSADQIVEYIADPAVAGGKPRQVAVAADGTRSAPQDPETEPYVVTTKDWFKFGMKAPGPGWTDFYKFTSGGFGITSTSRFTAPGATAPSGVFHADLRVERVSAFLATLGVGKRGEVFLVDQLGRRIVSPPGAAEAAAEAAVDVAAKRGPPGTVAAPVEIKTRAGDYEVSFIPLEIRGNLRLNLAVGVDLDEITAGIYEEAEIAAVIAIAATLIATLLGIVLATRISRPVSAIARDLATVGSFVISREPSPHSFVHEIDALGVQVDRMKASLRSFGHYVPTDLVRTLLAVGKEAQLGVESREITIHFSDIASFTTIAEAMEPHDLIAAMSRYFERMTEAIVRHGGTVDKFMGDGIMAFFNAPLDVPDHARQACLAALEEQAALAEMARDRKPGEPLFMARIGLGLGDVLVGNIGTPSRFEYTLLGDEVNLASRLEGTNKVYGTAIIADMSVVAGAGDGFEWRRLDRVAVKGRHQGTEIYELLGERGAVPAETLAARDLYESALAAYYAGDFTAAASGFDAAAATRSGDLGAVTMAARSRDLADAPPDAWEGIHVMHEK